MMKRRRIHQRLLVFVIFCCCAVMHHAFLLQRLSQQDPQSSLLWRQTPITATADQGNDTLIMNSFLTELQASIQQQTFSSITLYGPSKATLKKIADTEQTRGCLIRITGRLIQSKNSNKNGNKKTTRPSTQLQVTYKYHLATDIVKNWSLSSVSQSIQSLLLWTTFTSKSDSNNNSLLLDSSVVIPSEWGNPTPQQSQLGLHTATLETTTARYQLDLRSKTLSRHEISSTATTHTPQPHDRSKAVPVSSEAPMWQALGILNEQGKPRLNMASKYKQCQTFVQLLAQRIPFGSETPSEKPNKITVTDMGCGRGYLTFALHHYLSEQQQKHDNSFTVHSIGMDVRPKLVQEIQGIADRLGPPFDTLQFMTSTIEEYTSTLRTPDEDQGDDYQILMALHACDTATDDALFAGIQQEMDLLVVAPCCHRQIRPQLDAFHVQQKQQHALSDVWQYNIYRERHAESVTDTLRALLLEWAGYQVQVFEFVGGEHTSKNVMITAVRTAAARRRKKDDDELEQRIQSLAAFHGIHQHALAQHLGFALIPGKDVSKETAKKRSKYGFPQ